MAEEEQLAADRGLAGVRRARGAELVLALDRAADVAGAAGRSEPLVVGADDRVARLEPGLVEKLVEGEPVRQLRVGVERCDRGRARLHRPGLSLIHISEPTRLL